jgi:hypothetical protein
MAQIRKNREIEEDDEDLALMDLDAPEFSADARIEQKLRVEAKQQRTLRQFVKDVCSC